MRRGTAWSRAWSRAWSQAWSGRLGAVLGLLLLWPLAAAEQRWELQYFYDKNDSSLFFLDLQFPSPQKGAATGVVVEERRRRPIVALTGDGGRKWDLVPVPEAGMTLFFLNEQAGWMVSAPGHLWKTSDGGRTWKRAELRGIKAELLRVFFLDASHGWLLCMGKQIYATSDGGATWAPLAAALTPDTPAPQSLYDRAAFLDSQTALLTGWSRLASRRSDVPPWMEPERVPIGNTPTTSLFLHTTDGGRRWTPHVLPGFGEIARARLTSTDRAVVLARRPESLNTPTGLFRLSLPGFEAVPLYSNKNRWLADFALAGPSRAFLAAIDQEGRTPFPAIPSRVHVLQSADLKQWTEMEVDYRAEARHAVLAAPDDSHAWLATDTGMILRWVQE
jgi:hypothetical protein